MKKSLLFLCVCFTLFHLSSQSTDFPSGQAVWTTYENYPPDNIFHAPIKQSLQGDSIYQGLTYDILSVQGSESEIAGLIRSDGDQVYYIPADSTEESLWYDFGMNVGDTFHVPTLLQEHGFLEEYHIVSFVNSVVTNDGVERRQLHFESFTWLQGVGALLGSIDIYEVPFSSAQSLRYCFESNFVDVISDVVTDPNNGLTYDCNGLLNSVEEREEESVQVSPNPFTDHLTITDSEITELSLISLFDMNGRVQEINISENRIIPTTDLSQGVYFLLIQDDKQVYSHRVIKAE